MRNLRVARRYAKALILAAAAAELLAAARETCNELRGLIRESAEFRQFILDHLIAPTAKRETLTQLFGERFHPLLMSFLMLLVDNRRERDLDAILDEALLQLDEREGIERALVRSAVALSDEQVRSLAAALSRMRGANVQIQTEVDPVLKGGFIAYLADTIVDASIATQLERIRQAMIVG